MQTIRNLGKTNIINKIGKGEGMQKAADFMKDLIEGFAKQSAKYINAVSEAPFSYSERQLHSVLAPVISNIADAFLMEHPMERKWESEGESVFESYTGFLDYWCRYKGLDLFIELKHDRDAYKNDNIRQEAHKNWKKMNNEQLERVKDEAKRFSKHSKGILLIALHAFTVYETLPNSKESMAREDAETLLSSQLNYFDNLDPKPNWSGVWILHRDLFDRCTRDYENKKSYFPGVILVAKINELIKKDYE
jgi:hypothetical protein